MRSAADSGALMIYGVILLRAVCKEGRECDRGERRGLSRRENSRKELQADQCVQKDACRVT